MQVPFQVPLEVNIVLIGFNGDGGYRYTVDSQKLEEFLRVSFPSHRPSCLETGKPLDIEHHIVYNAFPVCFLSVSVIYLHVTALLLQVSFYQDFVSPLHYRLANLN